MDEIRRQLMHNKCLFTRLLSQYEVMSEQNKVLRMKNNELTEALIETQDTIRELLDALKEDAEKCYG